MLDLAIGLFGTLVLCFFRVNMSISTSDNAPDGFKFRLSE